MTGADVGQILTDLLNESRRCKLLWGGGGGGLRHRDIFWILTPWSRFYRVSESFGQDIGQFHSSEDCQGKAE